MRHILASIVGVILFFNHSLGQDTLPQFTAVIKSNGRVLISWKNNYRVVNQISIQRSKDSLKNFTTLLTVPDPSIPENGFVDSKPPNTNMYYRLFILLDNSRYTFSRSKRALSEEALATAKTTKKEDDILPRVDNQRFYYQDNVNYPKPSITVPTTISNTSPVEIQRTIYVKENDSVIASLNPRQLRQFRDSVLGKTKDTILFVHTDTVQIKPFIAPREAVKEVKEVYKVSAFVFTAKDGNVNIALPDAGRKKYAVKFYEQDNSPVLEVKDIKDNYLILDKANFIHSGWFRFELYEEGRLKEKNRLFIPKEF